MKRQSYLSAAMLFLFFAGCAGRLEGPAAQKVETFESVFRALGGLFALTSPDGTDEVTPAEQARIAAVVSRLRTPEEIGLFARCCREAVYPEADGERPFDKIFEYALWAAIEVLADCADARSQIELAELRKRWGTDPGLAELLDEAIEHQAEKVKEALGGAGAGEKPPAKKD